MEAAQGGRLRSRCWCLNTSASEMAGKAHAGGRQDDTGVGSSRAGAGWGVVTVMTVESDFDNRAAKQAATRGPGLGSTA